MSTAPSDLQPALAYETPQSQWDAVTLGAIAIKLLGLYCFVVALPVVSFVFFIAIPRFSRPWDAETLLVRLLPYAMHISIGVALIWLSDRISARLFGSESVASGRVPLRTPMAEQLQAIAFSVVGAWAMIQALPAALYWGVLVLKELPSRTPSETGPQLLQSVSQFVLGLFLFLRARGLAFFWHKLRTGGIIRHEPISPGRQP